MILDGLTHPLCNIIFLGLILSLIKNHKANKKHNILLVIRIKLTMVLDNKGYIISNVKKSFTWIESRAFFSWWIDTDLRHWGFFYHNIISTWLTICSFLSAPVSTRDGKPKYFPQMRFEFWNKISYDWNFTYVV